MTEAPAKQPDVAEVATARRVRSFVRREGRITPAQQRHLARLWPRYGLDPEDGLFAWEAVFGRRAAVTVDIGFGAGEALLANASNHPERDYIGIEIYRSGVGRALGAAEAAGLTNIRVLCADAVAVLAQAIPPASLAQVLLYFPDPWPKKRHHKRRLVQPSFADAVARALRPDGDWLLATDWADYAQWMRAVLDPHPAFANIGGADGYLADPARPATRFERRGQRKGHTVFDLAYRRL